MAKLLVLIRHGHRDNSVRELDNGLSEKGQGQARLLKKFFVSRFQPEDLKKGVWFVSSPKKRCIETLSPMAKAIDRTVDVHPDLLEQTGKENLSVFQGRVQKFIKEWRESKTEVTVVCSHGDWLPLATMELMGVPLDFKKGQWTEFSLEVGAGKAELKWNVPSFKSLIGD
jgi:broad specificity phosphatase PhoE